MDDRADAHTSAPDGSVRASSERVAAALCAATGVCRGRVDATTHRLMVALVSEYHGLVGRSEGVDYDPVADEFLTDGGELRVELDRFPVDPAVWESLLGAVAAITLLGFAAAAAGPLPEDARVLPVYGLGVVFAGFVARAAARVDVRVGEASDD